MAARMLDAKAYKHFSPVKANNWYLAFIWSDGSCDDSSGSIFGFSFAQQFQNMSVPFVVFGSL